MKIAMYFDDSPYDVTYEFEWSADSCWPIPEIGDQLTIVSDHGEWRARVTDRWIQPAWEQVHLELNEFTDGSLPGYKLGDNEWPNDEQNLEFISGLDRMAVALGGRPIKEE